jgi:membrane-bound inhibitor of C-type lysozyme
MGRKLCVRLAGTLTLAPADASVGRRRSGTVRPQQPARFASAAEAGHSGAMRKITLIAAASLLPLASPAFADVTFSTGLGVTGDAEIKTVKYDCEHHDPITVQYLNAAPNFLALVPVKEGTLAFVNVISGSGAKYVASKYTWWTKGNDATLADVTEGLDAAPVLTCTEEVDTP